MADFDADGLFRLIGRHGHGGMLGLRMVGHGADWATLALDPAPHLADADGAVATGAVLGMMDMATSMAVWLRRGGFVPQVTLDLRLDWLRPPPPPQTVLHGRGACHAIDGTVAFVSGTVHAGDAAAALATVAGSFMLFDGSGG